MWLTICSGQKQQSFYWDSQSYTDISLSLPWTNSIAVQSTQDTHIVLRYQSEGEYKNHLLLQPMVTEKTLLIHERLAPSYFVNQDKLSVHKVLASALELFVPESIKLKLKAENARIVLKGDFNDLRLELNQGSVHLDGLFAAGKIATKQADIEILSIKNHVFARTNRGAIEGEFSSAEESNLFLESDRGNISILSNRK